MTHGRVATFRISIINIILTELLKVYILPLFTSPQFNKYFDLNFLLEKLYQKRKLRWQCLVNLNPGSLFSDSRIKSAFNGLCIQPWWLGGRAVAAHSVLSTVSIMVGSIESPSINLRRLHRSKKKLKNHPYRTNNRLRPNRFIYAIPSNFAILSVGFLLIE